MKEHNTDKLSIVIPLYNEQSNLLLLYSEIICYVQKLWVWYEIIFVDDGSKDDSLSIVRRLHESDSNVKCISFSRNFWYEYALKAWLDKASGDWIVIMDADFQDPPFLIELLYQAKDWYDMVLAKRESRSDWFVKDTMARLFYRFINVFSDFDIPRDVWYCRLFSKKVLKAINSCNEYNRFLKGLFSYVWFRTITVPYARPKRLAGQTSFTFKKLLKLASQALFSLSTYPLKFSTIIGVVIAAFAFIVWIIQIVLKLFYDNYMYWVSTSIVLISLLWGIQLISIGIIWEYIARIYSELKHRPLYIVSEIIE